MSRRRPQIMILCEDKAHLHFLKGYFAHAGWRERQIISKEACPPAAQSAEQWVHQRYGETMRTLRSRHGQGRNVVLLVMIDGDRHDPNERKRQLDQEFLRSPGDPVAIFVPKRNIQTWFAYLDGHYADEDTDYKHRYDKRAPHGQFGKRLFDRCASGETEPLPPSLRDACAEWNRLPIS